MLAERNPQMKKAVGVLKELSADEVTRMLYEKREMARMDLESRIEMARMEKDVAVREVDEKWRNVVADKDAEIAQLRAQLQKQNGKSN